MSPIAVQEGLRVRTLFDAFVNSASSHPDKPALKGMGGRGPVFTYGDVLDRTRRLAAGLQMSRYAPLTQIGLLSENRPEWAVAYLAIVASGKTVVPMDANLKPGEIGGLIKSARLEAVFTSGRFEGLLHDLDPRLHLFSFEAGSSRYWADLMTEPGGFMPMGDRDSLAALIYTSGSTGAPKAVMLTHGNLLSNLESVARAVSITGDDTFLSILPLHHTFEATCGFLSPLSLGATVVYARSLKSKDIVEDLAANRVTCMCGVPLLFEKLCHAIQRRIQEVPWPRRWLFRIFFALSGFGWRLGYRWGDRLFAGLRRRAGLGQMRMMVSGGAPLPPSICRFFNLIGLHLLQGYGLTEASPVVSVNRVSNLRFGSSGPPMPGVEVRIDNPDEHGIGEVLVRGGNVTPGYKDNPEETAAVIRGGWLCTGDLGRLSDGHLWITGRAKNLIVSAAGKNIYPEELEERLVESPYVLEALVFGQRKKGRQGEEVRAIVVPDMDQFSHELGVGAGPAHRDYILNRLNGVVAEVNEAVSDYKRICGFEVRFEELEKTSTRKIKRFLYRGND